MQVKNYEFKVAANDINGQEERLKSLQPRYIGEDHQFDTYFNTSDGRLKLREGTIESALIFYRRKDKADAKESDIMLYKPSESNVLKEILVKAIGQKVVVEKYRKIYFIDNIKFHFDRVTNLGTFIEVEAIDPTGELGIEKLRDQCKFYVKFFEIKQDDFVAESYSDLLMKERKQ